MSSREDPMFNLLSSVGGIDSSRFLKPQSMKDQRVGRSQLSDRPPEVSSSQKSKKEYNGFQIPPGQSARGAFSKEAVSNVPFMSSKSSQRIPSGDTNSQLDALLSGSVSSKEMRPMRDASKAPANDLRNAQESRKPEKLQNIGMAHDDLDAVFASPGSSFPTATSHMSNASPDPFDLFGGLGTTSTGNVKEADQPVKGDMLGTLNFGQPERKPASPWEMESVRSQDSSDTWGPLTDARQGSGDVFQQAAKEEAPRANASGAKAVQQPTAPYLQPTAKSPPSYETAMRSSDSSKKMSPLGSKVSSPRHSNRYQAYKAEGARNDDSSETSPHWQGSSRKPRRANSVEWSQNKDQQKDGDVKDQAKQWLSAGREWITGASKKVAQAVKETQAQINSKLEELDARNSQGGQPSNHHRTSQQTKFPRGSPGSRGHSESDISDIPQYYFEWAATISALPAHEQSNTLAAMPDEDAGNIQRILRHRGRRASLDQTETALVEAAKKRSLSGVRSRQTERSSPLEEVARRSRSTEFSSPDRRQAASSPLEVKPRPQSASLYPPADTKENSGRHADSRAQSRQPPPPPTPETTPDLMGLDLDIGRVAPASSSHNAPPQTNRRDQLDDLMGLNSPSASEIPQAAGIVDEIDMLGISGEAQSTVFENGNSNSRNLNPTSQQSSPDIDAMFGNAQPQSFSTPGATDSMIDFGGEEAAVMGRQGHESLYQGGALDEAQAGEPEERKVARKKRLAAQHARMQKQLQDKMDRDRAEEAKREAQHDHRAVHRERIEAWKSGKKDNIRALLSTLHTILWENSGWTTPGMTDLVEPSKVKRSYMKANLVVHPDKVKQKGGSVEQIVIADMAFDTLKSAWSKFEIAELQRR